MSSHRNFLQLNRFVFFQKLTHSLGCDVNGSQLVVNGSNLPSTISSYLPLRIIFLVYRLKGFFEEEKIYSSESKKSRLGELMLNVHPYIGLIPPLNFFSPRMAFWCFPFEFEQKAEKNYDWQFVSLTRWARQSSIVSFHFASTLNTQSTRSAYIIFNIPRCTLKRSQMRSIYLTNNLIFPFGFLLSISSCFSYVQVSPESIYFPSTLPGIEFIFVQSIFLYQEVDEMKYVLVKLDGRGWNVPREVVFFLSFITFITLCWKISLVESNFSVNDQKTSGWFLQANVF